MATLSDADIADLILAAQKNYQTKGFFQVAQTYQNYEMLGRIMNEDQSELDGGTSISRRIMLGQAGTATMTGLYDTDTVNVGDTLVEWDIPWRYMKAYYAWDRREITIDTPAVKIVDMLDKKRAECSLSYADLLEAQGFSAPPTSSDKLNIYGVPFWIQKNATAGFNGGDPAGFSSGAGGIATGTYARWKNYTGTFTDYTDADLLMPLRVQDKFIKFKSPIAGGNKVADRYRRYTTMTVWKNMGNLARAQNDNLGSDLNAMAESVTFNGNPIEWVPYLDADTANPIYSINWDVFKFYVRTGENMRESDPIRAPYSHNVFVVWTDLACNMGCVDRRRCAVLYKV